MSDGQNRYFEPVDGSAHVEQLASIGSRVQRKKEQNKREQEKRRRKAGIEETLEDEKNQMENQTAEEDGHIDFHA